MPTKSEDNDYVYEALALYATKLESIIKDTLRTEEAHIAHFYDVRGDRVVIAEYTVHSNADYIVENWIDTMTVPEYIEAYGENSIPKASQLTDLGMQLIGEDTFHPKAHHLDRLVVDRKPAMKQIPVISVLDALTRISEGKAVYMEDGELGGIERITAESQYPMSYLAKAKFYDADPTISAIKDNLHYMIANLGHYCLYLPEFDATENLSISPSKRGKGYFVGMNSNLRVVFFDAHGSEYNNVTNRLQTKYDVSQGSLYALHQLELVSHTVPITPIKYVGK
ncbi:hypothetical protein EalM132_00027 [Exiguobacterium phage vB_EalM-132]|nr:hypothetical protein EalM132_00027 [Exiguobacterium phage vB_EalM-132]